MYSHQFMQKAQYMKKLKDLKIKERASLFLKDNHNLIALGIFAFALILRFSYAYKSGLWVDEGKYASIGRALLEHPLDYTSRLLPLITDTPPVFPYMLFFSQLLFGAGDAVRIVNPILGSLSVLLVYALGRTMFNKNVGLIAAALLSVSPIAWFYDERVLLETPMAFFSLLTIFTFYWGYEKKNNKVLYSSGVFFVLAYLSKQNGGFVLPAIIAYLVYAKKLAWLKEKRIWMTALIALLVVSPWVVRSFSVCGNFSCEGAAKLSYFFKIAGGNADSGDVDVIQDPYYYLKLTPYLLTTPVLVLFFFGLIPLINGKYKKEHALLLSFAAIIYLFFAMHGVKDLRFVLLAVPAILLVAAEGIDEISKQLAGKELKYAPLIALVILAPIMYMSYGSGKALILDKAPGFLMLKDTGLYFEKMPADTIIMASPYQPISFYGGDKNMSHFPENQTDLAKTIRATGTSYLVIDAYERTQRQWIASYVPQQPYLIPEKVLYQNDQPVVVIFKVDGQKLSQALQN